MGKLTSFEISFQQSKAVYFGGSTVKGVVNLELKESMRMRAVRMTCFGRAFVRWTEVENVGHRGGRQRQDMVDYNAEEEYFQYRFNLWSQGTEEDGCLGTGQHAFPFQFKLPEELPPSFEGAYGSIRYWTKATIDKPWKIDHHTKRAFTVLPSLDLNQEPNAAEPLRYHGELGTGCCCLPSGRFSGTFSTDRRGYVPGSHLRLSADIRNRTSSTCWAEVKLKLHITYLAEGKFKQEKKIVCSSEKDHITRGKSYIWEDVMTIPPIPPSRLKGCKLIKSQYIIQFRVGSDNACSCDDIEYEDEIIIGSLPLRPASTAAITRTVAPGLTMDPTAASEIIRENTAAGGPSYEECVLFGRVSIKDKDDTEQTLGELVFAPLYAFYSLTSEEERNQVVTNPSNLM